jgi:hypothetical protein
MSLINSSLFFWHKKRTEFRSFSIFIGIEYLITMCGFQLQQVYFVQQ